MAIVVPQRKPGAIDRLAQGLGLVNNTLGIASSGYNLYRGVKDAGRRDEEYEKAKTQEAQFKDASSPLSQAARKNYQAYSDSPIAETVSAYELEKTFGPLANYTQSKFKSGQDLAADKEKIAFKALEDRKTELAKLGGLTGDAAKLAKLSGTDKQRYDHVMMANDAVKDMATALAAGKSRYSLIGDNDYTAALTRFEDAMGRMQSGGAINKDEGDRFRALARSAFDDPKMQAQKLQQLQQIMQDRFRTLGFDPSKNDRFAYQVTVPKAQDPTTILKEAKAGAGTYKPTPEDIKMLQWAQNNPGDPTAKEIVKELRARGL